MSLGYNANYNANADEEPTDALVGVTRTPQPARAVLEAPRSRVRDSWDWIWKDTLQRVLPLTVTGLVAARLFEAERKLGYARAGWLGETLLGVAVGAPLAAITAVFRAWVAPGYRLPTRGDQAVQTTFYLAINAPAEELFWRGTVQRLTARLAEKLLARAPGMRGAATPVGWAVATATYGLYHRLGGWSWRSIAGVTFAGGIFGALYQSRPRDRSLLAVTIAHGLTTAAFLSWGDVFLHQLKLWKARRQSDDPPIRVVDARR